MSYARTPELPREHPLAKLIERSTRAHKLPSCEGCKFASCIKYFDKAPELSDYDCQAAVTTNHEYQRPGSVHNGEHFCAAWEPRT